MEKSFFISLLNVRFYVRIITYEKCIFSMEEKVCKKMKFALLFNPVKKSFSG